MQKQAGIIDWARGYFRRSRAPKGEFERVESSNIEAVKYEPERKTMTVRFNSGGVYEYDNVPKHKHTQMMGAKSKGKFLNQHVKGQHDFSKVDNHGNMEGAQDHFLKAAAWRGYARAV